MPHDKTHGMTANPLSRGSGSGSSSGVNGGKDERSFFCGGVLRSRRDNAPDRM
jgi:hypothetical protein